MTKFEFYVLLIGMGIILVCGIRIVCCLGGIL